jgi:DNA excision repair protein ERCC-8
MWLEELRRRERGELRARRFEALARSRRAASLALSNRKEIATPHHGAVNSLQVTFFPHLAPPNLRRKGV